MIAYQLPTGKTIFIDGYDLLFMTDLDEQELIANDVGCFINNPFYQSSIDGSDSEIIIIDEINLEEIPDLDSEINYDI